MSCCSQTIDLEEELEQLKEANKYWEVEINIRKQDALEYQSEIRLLKEELLGLKYTPNTEVLKMIRAQKYLLEKGFTYNNDMWESYGDASSDDTG